MTTFRKWLPVVGAIMAVVVAGIFLIISLATSSTRRAHRDREAVLKPLLHSHATREQVPQMLGLVFVDCSVGSTNHSIIEERGFDPKIRQLADRYPCVLFHTTKDLMTLLFFDSERRLQDYYLCDQ